MRKLLTISLAAAAVISFAWTILSNISTLRCRTHGYRCAVLTEDLVLLGQGTDAVLGTLKKGTVLFAPAREDMSVTDPGDFQLHKIYVRIHLDAIDNLILLPSKRSDIAVPKTVCNVLEAIQLSAFTNELTTSCK